MSLQALRNRSYVAGFTLLELLASVAILGLLMLALSFLMNATLSSFKRASGNLDTFEASRAAFDTLSRTLRQATLLSYLGYDDPLTPTRYQLKSELHFISGPQSELGLTLAATRESHAIFFQAPLGVSHESALRMSDALLSPVGYFIAYGEDPNRPLIPDADTRLPSRIRFRLFEYIQPREATDLYSYTITRNPDGIPLSNEAYEATDWFAQNVNQADDQSGIKPGPFCHVLADNVIALAILPLPEDDGTPRSKYLWNSRDAAVQDAHHRLPKSVRVAMAVIDEASAARYESLPNPAPLVPEGIFSKPEDFDADVERLEKHLQELKPGLVYRIFTTEIIMARTSADL